MTDTTPIPASDAGLPGKKHTEQAEARLREFCLWFDLEMPKLRKYRGRIQMTDELLKFADREGLSLDWFVCGDAGVMAAAARRVWQQEREFAGIVRQLDDREKEILKEAMLASLDQRMPMRDALAACQVAIDRYRAEKAGAGAA